MQPARLFVQRLANFTGRRGYQTNKNFRQVTMNDMPVPQGDFFELEAKRNKKYNAILAAGIFMTVSSLIAAKETGLIELHLDPPKSID